MNLMQGKRNLTSRDPRKVRVANALRALHKQAPGRGRVTMMYVLARGHAFCGFVHTPGGAEYGVHTIIPADQVPVCEVCWEGGEET